MSNVLGDDKQQQVLALGRLGWSLRRIEAATGVRRETASDYLKAAGIRGPRSGRTADGSGRQNRPHDRRCPPTPSPADRRPKPAISEVSTDSGADPRRAERRVRARASRIAS